MKKILLVMILGLVLLPVWGEVRVGVNTEFYNSITSVSGIDETWSYTLTGQAGLSFKNASSRAIRGEVALDFTEVGPYLMPSLRKLYIRPSFGGVRVSVGKTRTTWGAGFAFNAGDVIFGSDSVDFNTQATDPRTETAWLTSVEIPLGAFSFVEGIALPGSIDVTDPLAPVMPALDKTSAGLRLSFEAGVFNIQAGYLYRGDLIAGMGPIGHRAYISLEGIAPLDWHLSTSATTDVDRILEDVLKDSWMITGGASYNSTLGPARGITLGWHLEALAKPYGSFEENHDEAGPDTEYGLYLFPSINFIPPGNVVYSISSVVSPVDLSANTTAGVSWNIYEELILLWYCSFQTGQTDDIFNSDNPGGMSFTLGGRYSY
jgi:hypothetical protein